jgi:hypothetical protein
MLQPPLRGEALHHRAPVGRLIIQVHADFAEHVGCDLADRVQRRQIGRCEVDQPFAFVASGFEIAFHLVQVTRAGERRHADVRCHR